MVKVIRFTAPWCAPCRMLAPIIETLKNEISDVEWEVVDVDQHPEKATENGVRSVPTVMIYNGDTLVETIVGVVSKNDYTKVITNAKNIF